MKVLAICGSPRDGNTEAMLKSILTGAKSKGAAIELVRLRDLKIEFCDGCGSCEKTGKCRILDEMQPLYRKTLEADTLILGSPNYFNNVSAIMKNFFDRFNPYWENPRLKGKKVVLAMPGGYNRESIEKGLKVFEEFPRICKMEVVERIGSVLEGPREARKNENLMKQCFEAGQKLVVEK